MNTKRQLFQELIRQGEFLKAYKLFDQIDHATLEGVLFGLGCDEENLCAYSFACFLLLKKETIQMHSLASGLLNIAFCHYNGAYQTSLYHSKRSIELQPDDISLQEDLLFFNVVPEKIISNKEAHKIALEILQKSHSSPAALDTLERIKDDVEARQQ